MRVRPFATTVATLYTLAGIGALLVGFVLPAEGPLAAIYAVLLGAPWVQLFGRLDLFTGESTALNIALVTASVALNAGLLWWWALTRRRG